MRRPATAVPSEHVLTGVALGWAVVLWLPRGAFAESTGFAAIERAVGGEGALAALMTLLAVAHLAGLFLAKWPPRWRAKATFAAALWWTFAGLESLLARWWSPAWVTLAGLAALAYLTWGRLRRAQVLVQFSDEEAAARRPRTEDAT